jgi:sugar lactone lactonase YvrE
MSWFGPRSILAECPRWDDEAQLFSWVDIDAGILYTSRLECGEPTVSSYPIGAPLSGAVRTDRSEETWLVALGTCVAAWTPGAGVGAPHRVESDSATCPLRLNEMVTDPLGRVWVGSMAYDWTASAGSYFRIDFDGHIHRMLSGITIANGVGWSPDGTTMYTTDTALGQIVAWTYDLGHGRPTDPIVLVEGDGSDGRPDGLAVDEVGNIWSAFAGGGHVSCFAPSGRRLARLTVPTPTPTSCCFAGPDRDRLLVTTARKRLSLRLLREYPDAGRVFDLGRVGARGLCQTRAACQ